MSQHCCRTTLPDGTGVTVTAGWDFPLRWYYLNIEGAVEDARTDEDGFFYSNLTDPNAPHDDWTYFMLRLAEHGIRIPSEMAAAIRQDGARRTRNAETDWST